MIVRLLLPVSLVVACSKPATSTSGGSASGAGSAEPGSAEAGGSSAGGFQSARGGSETADDSDPCSAAQLGLTGAKKLGRKMLRRGCWPKQPSGPLLITKQADFTAHVDCGSDASTDDAHNWTNGMLVVTAHSPSPAEVGLLAYDDGKAITFVSMQRTPCPNDPRPMPGPSETHVFVAEPNGQRTFADRACTVTRRCE